MSTAIYLFRNTAFAKLIKQILEDTPEFKEIWESGKCVPQNNVCSKLMEFDLTEKNPKKIYDAVGTALKEESVDGFGTRPGPNGGIFNRDIVSSLKFKRSY